MRISPLFPPVSPLRPTRRDLIRLGGAGIALFATSLAGCAMPRATDPAQAEAVAPGVWMVRGAPGEPDAANWGRIGNAGFIVGPTGVLVIDSGVSQRHGLALLCSRPSGRSPTDRCAPWC